MKELMMKMFLLNNMNFMLSIVWSRPFQVEREEGSGDTPIPNAFC